MNSAERYRTMRDTLGPNHPDTQEAFASRLDEVLTAEVLAPEHGLWWLSFTDPTRPPGTQFLGVVVVEAIGSTSAIAFSHALGVNPGGQVSAWGPLPSNAIGPEWRNRLLSREEAESIQAPNEDGEL